MLRLGHIEYSNCVPVHALLLERRVSGIELVRDVPAALNAALAAGRIDVAPCSSIEYARHAGEYRVLPSFAIGADGPVQSILLESTVPLEQLGGRVVAVPTASATSVVLLRALLEIRLGVQPQFRWFEQTSAADPLLDGAAAALRIGDVALTHTADPGHAVYDLGAEWRAWTGLPFAFAVWQVRRDADPAEVRRLMALLHESRAWFNVNTDQLARRHAPAFGLSARRLLDYWASLRYALDAPMRQGLLHFYELAAELGAAPPVHDIEIFALEPG
jgi:chorismate dehydratase